MLFDEFEVMFNFWLKKYLNSTGFIRFSQRVFALWKSPNSGGVTEFLDVLKTRCGNTIIVMLF